MYVPEMRGSGREAEVHVVAGSCDVRAVAVLRMATQQLVVLVPVRNGLGAKIPNRLQIRIAC